jgi:hypothetical protein
LAILGLLFTPACLLLGGAVIVLTAACSFHHFDAPILSGDDLTGPYRQVRRRLREGVCFGRRRFRLGF